MVASQAVVGSAAIQVPDMALRLIKGNEAQKIYKTSFLVATGHKKLQFAPEVLGIPQAVISALSQVKATHRTALEMYPRLAECKNSISGMKSRLTRDCKMQASGKEWLLRGDLKAKAQDMFLDIEDAATKYLDELKAGLDAAELACEQDVKFLLSSTGLNSALVDNLWNSVYKPQFYTAEYLDENFYVSMARPVLLSDPEAETDETSQRIAQSEQKALAKGARASLEGDIRQLREELSEALAKTGLAGSIANSDRSRASRLKKAAELRDKVRWTSGFLRYQAGDLEAILQSIEADLNSESAPFQVVVKPEVQEVQVAEVVEVAEAVEVTSGLDLTGSFDPELPEFDSGDSDFEPDDFEPDDLDLGDGVLGLSPDPFAVSLDDLGDPGF